jgi:hypothetical protein
MSNRAIQPLSPITPAGITAQRREARDLEWYRQNVERQVQPNGGPFLMKNYHLTPEPSGEWTLRPEGTDHVLGTYDTKEDALEMSIQHITRHTGSLKIHRADGTIEEERTYPRLADPAKSPE